MQRISTRTLLYFVIAEGRDMLFLHWYMPAGRGKKTHAGAILVQRRHLNETLVLSMSAFTRLSLVATTSIMKISFNNGGRPHDEPGT